MSLPRRTIGILADAIFPDSYDRFDQIRDFQAVFVHHPAGPRVLALLADLTGWFDASPPVSLATGGDIPHAAAFAQGRRSVMQDIAAVIEEPPEPGIVTEEG